jgi:hypothetical protein
MAGFSEQELTRLSGCLARLMPHVSRAEMALTGGVAIQLGLAALGRTGSRTAIADLDFVLSRVDAIAATVTESFVVSHYHTAGMGGAKFMIQLVDPIFRLRLDMFPDLAGSLARAQTFMIGTQTVNVLDLQSILDHKLATLSNAWGREETIDPKHYLDAQTLGTIFGREVPAAPKWGLAKDIYGGEADLNCRRCELSRAERFPLAPKPQIFELLGWVPAR